MKVAIGTKNQKKVAAVSKIFKEQFGLSIIEVIPCSVESGVPDAPHDDETYRGALQRAQACKELGEADYYVGIESGLVERYGNLFEEAWAVVITSDNQKFMGYSSGLMLPSIVAERMNSGEAHDKIMADYDKLFNLPEDNRDTWSRYTGGLVSRQLSLDEALRNAIIQMIPSENNLYQHFDSVDK